MSSDDDGSDEDDYAALSDGEPAGGGAAAGTPWKASTACSGRPCAVRALSRVVPACAGDHHRDAAVRAGACRRGPAPRAAAGAVKGPSLTEAGCDAHARAQAAALAHVTSVLGVGGHAARTLLMHHRWSEEALFAAFAERGLDDALRDAGALSRAAAEAPAPGAQRRLLATRVRCARGAARTAASRQP